MQALEWIEKVKSKTGIESDYGIAKLLGLSRQALSAMRNGRSYTLGEETSVKVAEALQINAAGVVLDQAAEKIKDEGIRTSLLNEARRLCILC